MFSTGTFLRDKSERFVTLCLKTFVHFGLEMGRQLKSSWSVIRSLRAAKRNQKSF